MAVELVTSSLPAQLAVVRAVNAAFELPPDEGFRCEALLEQGLFTGGEAAEASAPSSPSARRTSPEKSRRD